MEQLTDYLVNTVTMHEVKIAVLIGWNIILSVGVFAVLLRRN